jgi:hypothetical protein
MSLKEEALAALKKIETQKVVYQIDGIYQKIIWEEDRIVAIEFSMADLNFDDEFQIIEDALKQL